jgi:hypothetical protein
MCWASVRYFVYKRQAWFTLHNILYNVHLLHKNVIDDKNCAYLHFSFLSTLPIERVRNNQLEAYAGNHILTSTKYTITIHILLYVHVLGSYGSAPDRGCVASSWQNFSAITAERKKKISNLDKKGSKMRFLQKN